MLHIMMFLKYFQLHMLLLNIETLFLKIQMLPFCSALRYSILIVDSWSSISIFLSSMLSCTILYCLSSAICSLFGCDSSDKSDDKLLVDDHSFFLKVGTTLVIILIQGAFCKVEAVSRISGLYQSTFFGSLSSKSEVSKSLIEDMVDN